MNALHLPIFQLRVFHASDSQSLKRWPSTFVSDRDNDRFQIARVMGQPHRTILGNDHTVRDRIPALPRTINAGFTRYRHSRRKDRVVAILDPRWFMILDANAVPLTVLDKLAHARI